MRRSYISILGIVLWHVGLGLAVAGLLLLRKEADRSLAYASLAAGGATIVLGILAASRAAHAGRSRRPGAASKP